MMAFLFLFMAVGVFISSFLTGLWAPLLFYGVTVSAFTYFKLPCLKAFAIMLILGSIIRPLSDVSKHVRMDEEQEMSAMGVVRSHCMEKMLQTGLDATAVGIAEGCLFGYKDNIDSATKDDFRHAGMSHLLAVSGLHIGLVMLAIFIFLSPIVFLPHGDMILRVLTIVGIWLYVLVVGAPPSACRAAMMLSLVLAGYLFERHGNEWDMWGISGICLLVYDSSLLWNLSFQLSYLATGGIFVVLPRIRYGSRRLIERMRGKSFARRWWLTPVLGIRASVYVSVAAQLATAPVVLYYMHTMPFLGVLQGILVVPLMPLLMGILFLLLGASYLGIPFIVSLFSKVAQFVIDYMRLMAHWVATIDEWFVGGHIWVRPSVFEACLIAVVAWGLLFFLAYRSEREKSQFLY